MSTVKLATNVENELGLPRIDQIGFVVSDIKKAMEDYGPLFGPWVEMDSEVSDADYRGEQQSCKLKMAFGQTGDLEIELIEVVEGECPHAEFLQRGLNGMHHLRYRIDNMDKTLEAAKKIGYQSIWHKKVSDDTEFCYLERPGDALLIELLVMPDLVS